MSSIYGVGGPSVEGALETKEAKAAAQERLAEQVSSQKEAQADAGTEVTPWKTQEKAKKIETRNKRVSELQKMKETMGLFVDSLKSAAERHHQKNREFNPEALVLLRQKIKPGFSKDEILNVIKEFYKDPTLIDEVFDFLLETTQGDLREAVAQAKADHYNQNEGEIIAGRNIEAEVHRFVDKGMGEPIALRDEYRKFIKEAPDATTMFEQLTTRYPNYKEIKQMAAFLFHALGADLKAEKHAVEPAKLQELMVETRVLQSICQVFRFFEKRF